MTPLEEKLMQEIQGEPWYQEQYKKEIVRILARLYFMGKKEGLEETEFERKLLKQARSKAELFTKLLGE